MAAARFPFEGKVLDATGMPIAGARVTAVPQGQNSGPSTLTDERGEFTIVLDAGRYIITVGAAGFLEISQPFDAPQNGVGSRAFVLQVAGPRETVNVNAPAAYQVPAIMSATKTLTPLRDVPQSVTVVTRELIRDQAMTSIGDVVRYVPGITAHQGENNRDQVIIRGNSSSADFFVNGVRDDVQYYRDLYNLDRVEALKGSNAMIFGRGGAGGVVNRVTKQAGFQPLSEISLQSGSYDNKRFTIDLDRPLNATAAFRVNGLYENSDSFRHGVGLERSGLSPTLMLARSDRTKIALAYEYFQDARVADRGLSSYQGRPAHVDVATFYGNPADSHVRATVNLGSVAVEHQTMAGVLVRNHTLIGGYDRSYQNFVPGAVTADQSQVALTAYNNATKRLNVFNQTDVTYAALSTGRFRHTLLAGVEVGRQGTDNFRNTGFFNNTATSILVPYANPTITTPVTFRQSSTDADNHLRTSVMAAYAQDQVQVSRLVQVVAGLRFDRFDLEYHNNRNGDTLDRADNLVSPRIGVVIKPRTPLSFYTSYSVSYLPSSGDQFSSLTIVTRQVEPEKFSNYEIGAKWDVYPDLSMTTAVYRLDRTNTRSTDPNDPTRIVQTGSQTTNGYELGVNGRVTPAWRIAGGYAYQDAFVARATTAAAAGATVAQVPSHTFSLWNSYQFHPKAAAGVGVLTRSDMFAAIDNAVTVPGYTRVDAAFYYSIGEDLRLQMNVENLFETTYYVNADSNTNISPGVPRAVRVGLTAAF
ncbi:MAG: TonB-dependent siderophore receptor [Vicinamibacterales bacterium]